LLLQHFKSLSSRHIRKAKPMLILILLQTLSHSLFVSRSGMIRGLRFSMLHVNLSLIVTINVIGQQLAPVPRTPCGPG